MPRSPSARCIHDLGIASAPIVFSGVLVGCVLDRALRVAKKVGARAAALERCLRDLGSITRWNGQTINGQAAPGRDSSVIPESAPAEACLKREACMRCYELWFGSAMTHCPQKARNISNGCGHRRTTVLRYATAASCANGQGALSHGCHRIAQNFSSRCPRAQLRRDEENAC
jgi:hypothetical protein